MSPWVRFIIKARLTWKQDQTVKESVAIGLKSSILKLFPLHERDSNQPWMEVCVE